MTRRSQFWEEVAIWVAALAAAALLSWCDPAAEAAPEAACETDTECMEQCLRTLPPNRPETECEI